MVFDVELFLNHPDLVVSNLVVCNFCMEGVFCALLPFLRSFTGKILHPFDLV